MIRILDRHVARQFMRLFTVTALAAPLLFILGDWTDHIDAYTAPERGLTLGKIALAYFYQMPQFISWSFPIAALVATVFTVSDMTRHSEMAAAKAGGISFYRALAILPVLGVILTFVGLYLSEITPAGTMKRNAIMGATSLNLGDSRSDFVYATPDGDAVVVRNLDASANRITGITIQREGDGVKTSSELVYADSAVYKGGRWHLMNGLYRTFWQDTLESTFHFEELVSDKFRENPEQLTATPKVPEEMTYRELGHYIDIQQRSGQQPRKLMVERMKKIAIPVATLIIILFGAPLANTSARGGPAYGIGLSLGVTIFYMMFFKVTEAMGQTGVLSPFWAAWMPNAIVLLAAIVAGFRIKT